MEINDIVNDVTKLATEKGFWKDYDRCLTDEGKRAFISQKLMLVVSELSEALEALREDHRSQSPEVVENAMRDPKNESLESFKELFEERVKNSFEDELADAVIRIADLAGKLNINLDWHIQRKMEYNGTRPYKHGKNF